MGGGTPASIYIYICIYTPGIPGGSQGTLEPLAWGVSCVSASNHVYLRLGSMAAPGISDCSITEMAETPTNHGSHLHVPAPSTAVPNAHGEWSGETPPTRLSSTQRRHARSGPCLQTLSTIDEDDPPLPPPIQLQHEAVDADIPPTWLTILRKLLEPEDEKKSASVAGMCQP